MIKIDLNWKFKGLDGKEMQGDDEAVHAGKFLASALSSQRESKSPEKNWEWSLSLFKKQPLVVDSADFKDLRSFVATHKGFFAIAQAQLLIAFDEAKEVEKSGSEKEAVKKK